MFVCLTTLKGQVADGIPIPSSSGAFTWNNAIQRGKGSGRTNFLRRTDDKPSPRAAKAASEGSPSPTLVNPMKRGV